MAASFWAPRDLLSGKASIDIPGLAVGLHTITASYQGSTTYSASSGSLTRTTYLVPTYTVVTVLPDPAVFGQAVTLTATISAGGGGRRPACGSVTLKDGSTALGTIALSGGKAVFSTSALTVGSQTITASYSGVAKFSASDNSLTETVTGA